MKLSDLKISSDIFLLSDTNENNYILYLPLLGIVSSADAVVINILYDIDNGNQNIISFKKERVIKQLLSAGIIKPVEARYEAQIHAEPNLEEPFHPCEVTLFLTSDCNLSCRYCYGESGDRKEKMTSEIAFAAIDHVFQNAKKKQKQNVCISFHGGGEPTLEFGHMQKLVEYANNLAIKTGIHTHYGLTTNGTMGKRCLSWIIDHIDNINISIDGPEDIQNYHRPTRRGTGSFRLVDNTLKTLTKVRKKYCLRSTISDYSQKRIPEIVSFFIDHYDPDIIQIEPMFNVGRAIHSKISTPFCEDFVTGFTEAESICKEAGVSFKFSGLRFPQTNCIFCGAGRKNFAVTPNGKVTACFEVLDPHDRRSELFFIGQYKNGSFIFDKKRIANLRKLNENIPPACKNCFAKYHCMGDCRGKGLFLNDIESYKGGGRCDIIQGLIKKKLFDSLK